MGCGGRTGKPKVSSLSYVQRDNLRLEFSIFLNRQQADGNGQFKAAGAAGAGVEVEDSFFGYVVGDVGVAVKDGGEFGGGGVEVDGLEVVEKIEVAVLKEDDFGFGELGAEALAVDVAADGGYGGDGSQLGEDGDFAYVAYVEDVVDAAEGGEDFRTEEAVGVGEDAEFHGFGLNLAFPDLRVPGF